MCKFRINSDILGEQIAFQKQVTSRTLQTKYIAKIFKYCGYIKPHCEKQLALNIYDKLC